MSRSSSPAADDHDTRPLIPLDDFNPGPLSVSKADDGEQYGVPKPIEIISLLDVCAVIVSLIALALALVVIYKEALAIYLGSKYQLSVFGLLLSIQGYCTARQVLQCAQRCLLYKRKATMQDVVSISQNSITIKNASWLVRMVVLALTMLSLLLAFLYKQFAFGSTMHKIPSITGQFGIIPPPNLDNINGNGITLAVNSMTPFWQKRQHTPLNNKTFGENMLFLDESSTAMLDTPMLRTFDRLRSLLSQDFGRNQSLRLSADVNATVATIVDMSTQERSDFAKAFDMAECKVSNFYRCAITDRVFHAGMVFGGVSDKFAPAASPTINYAGIWEPAKQNFSDVVRKVKLTRQEAYGVWRIYQNSVELESAHLKEAGVGTVNQSILSAAPRNLHLLAQLLQEYNYVRYDFGLTDPFASLMASITWSRLATLHIEDRDRHQLSWAHAKYNKHAGTYTLQLEGRTVSRSYLLALIFVVNPIVVIAATVIKSCLYKTPISDGFGIISLLSCASEDGLKLLGGAGYSGELSRKVWIWFDTQPGTDSVRKDGKIYMHLSGSEKPIASSLERLEAGREYK